MGEIEDQLAEATLKLADLRRTSVDLATELRGALVEEQLEHLRSTVEREVTEVQPAHSAAIGTEGLRQLKADLTATCEEMAQDITSQTDDMDSLFLGQSGKVDLNPRPLASAGHRWRSTAAVLMNRHGYKSPNTSGPGMHITAYISSSSRAARLVDEFGRHLQEVQKIEARIANLEVMQEQEAAKALWDDA